jgi:hypothetical protein
MQIPFREVREQVGGGAFRFQSILQFCGQLSAMVRRLPESGILYRDILNLGWPGVVFPEQQQ